MLYWRGDLRYIFFVAVEQYMWIRNHLDFISKDYQVNGAQIKKPDAGVRSESWEWTIEPGHAPLVDEFISSKRETRFNKRAV